MKNIYVISCFIFFFNYSFSQDSENRSKRDWNDGNQSTYSIENIRELKQTEDEANFVPVDSDFDGFKNADWDNDSVREQVASAMIKKTKKFFEDNYPDLMEVKQKPIFDKEDFQ